MDVAHAEIVLPSASAERVDMEWALDRSRLWNAAEHSGRQWNSRMAREVARKIENEMTYPGQVKVTVIREMRAVDYAK